MFHIDLTPVVLHLITRLLPAGTTTLAAVAVAHRQAFNHIPKYKGHFPVADDHLHRALLLNQTGRSLQPDSPRLRTTRRQRLPELHLTFQTPQTITNR